MLRQVSQVRRYAAAAGMLMLSVLAPSLVSQDKTVTARPATSLTYDVASVRPVRPEERSKIQTRMLENGKTEETATMTSSSRFVANGYTARNTSVMGLIMDAYGIHKVDRIKGLPDWENAVTYNIEARMDDSAVQEFQKLSKDEQRAQRQAMLQALLADRFRLKAHFEEKQMPIYEIVVNKSGIKAKPAAPDGHPSTPLAGHGVIKETMSIDSLASLLSAFTGQTFVDKTGVSGKFDISLTWNPEASSAPDDFRQSLPDAMKDQLGLKLVSAKGNVNYLMVDQVEKPSEN